MIKRFFDISLALLLLLVCSPLIFVISFLIMMTCGRPILFKQTRVGYKRRLFTIYKFRTMIPNSELSGTGLYSFSSDPRITPIGYWLRILSLDELPQLLNILRGDMSFVGPRPPVHFELGPPSEYPNILRQRFDVMPGITGLAQVSGRNHNNWDEKLGYDLQYINSFRRFGVFADIGIILLTVYSLLIHRNTVEIESPAHNDGPISSLARKHSGPF